MHSNWFCHNYLKDPSKKVNIKIRFQAIKYVLLEEELYYRTIDGVLLKCIDKEEEKVLMGECDTLGVCTVVVYLFYASCAYVA